MVTACATNSNMRACRSHGIAGLEQTGMATAGQKAGTGLDVQFPGHVLGCFRKILRDF